MIFLTGMDFVCCRFIALIVFLGEAVMRRVIMMRIVPVRSPDNFFSMDILRLVDQLKLTLFHCDPNEAQFKRLSV